MHSDKMKRITLAVGLFATSLVCFLSLACVLCITIVFVLMSLYC